MSIIDKFLDRYFEKKGLKPGSQNNSMPHMFMGNSIAAYNGQNAIDEGYAGNADVYAIVSLIIRKAASIPWYVYKKKGGPKAKQALGRYKNATDITQMLIEKNDALGDIVENSALARLIARPNPQQGQDSFFENLYGYRWLTGEGLTWGNDGDSNNPLAEILEMYVLPTQYMELIPDPDDIYGLLGWKLLQAGGFTFPKEDVLQWKSFNPQFDAYTRNHLRGLSPLQAAYKTLQMANEAEKSSYAMMANGGAKGALSPEPFNNMVVQPTPEQAADIKRAINQNINGSGNAGAVSVLQSPWKYLQFGMNARDMTLIETQKITLEKLCRIFGCPVILFSPDHMADNNYQNAMRDLVTNTIVPMISSLRDEMNRWLGPRFGNGEYIDFDVQALPELQRDIEKLVNGLKSADWLTFDEKRVAMGYEEMKGAYATSYINSSLVSIENAGIDMTQQEDDGKDSLNA